MPNIIHGLCEDVLKTIPSESVDIVFTSPPYADRRKQTYGGIKADKYIDWFSPIATEIKRILKPTGSFFLNIKHHTEDGERELYVFELVIYLKRVIGFKFIDDFAWTKNAFPGALSGRFKNGWEPVFHFAKSGPGDIIFNPEACGTMVKEESKKRAFRKQSGAPKNGSGMTGMNTTNFQKITIARPSNVIHVNNVSNQFMLKSKHSATFPVGLPEFFLKSFSNKGGLVIDPFAGSGTTAIAAINCGMDWVMIDKEESNIKLIEDRIKRHVKQLDLF